MMSEMRRPVAKCATPLLASARHIKFLVPTIMLQIARAHFIFSQRGGYKVDSGEDGAHWQVHEALHVEPQRKLRVQDNTESGIIETLAHCENVSSPRLCNNLEISLLSLVLIYYFNHSFKSF